MVDRKDIKSGELAQLIANYLEDCSLADLAKLANVAFAGVDVKLEDSEEFSYNAQYNFGFEE